MITIDENLVGKYIIRNYDDGSFILCLIEKVDFNEIESVIGTISRYCIKRNDECPEQFHIKKHYRLDYTAKQINKFFTIIDRNDAEKKLIYVLRKVY